VLDGVATWIRAFMAFPRSKFVLIVSNRWIRMPRTNFLTKKGRPVSVARGIHDLAMFYGP